MASEHSERTLPRRVGEEGHSLLETLVVLAIIGTLIVLQAPALTKALRLAKATAGKEAVRQRAIGRMADSKGAPGRPTKEEARSAFYQVVATEYGQEITSEMLFVVRDDAEFRAYWYTLLDPGNPGTLQFSSSGELVAVNAEGDEFTLRPIRELLDGAARYPMSWEFISTVLSETSRGDLGGNVEWSDGHVAYVSYPLGFPMTPTVALLSHRFLELGGAQ